MERPLYAVLLAGRIRPSPLSEALDVPVLCLPVGQCGSLLDEWLKVLGELPGLQQVQVVVNSVAEVDSVRAILRACGPSTAHGPCTSVIAEPAAWRGAAGIARDVTRGFEDDAIVIVCEAKCLPPISLQPLMQSFSTADINTAGVVGLCGDNQPAGVCAFSQSAMKLIPAIGYFDLKEQFLPALQRGDQPVASARLGETVWRVNDLESYLACVQHSINCHGGSKHLRVSRFASISPSAVLEGCCIIEAGAVVEDGAVVHDSVVLWGATVGGGSVVTRSVIGSLASVAARSRVVRSVLSRPAGPTVLHEWNSEAAHNASVKERMPS